MQQKRGETKRKWVEENFRLPPLSNRTLRVFLGGIEEKGFFIGSGSKKTESSGLPLPSVYPRIHGVLPKLLYKFSASPQALFSLRLFLFSDTNLPLAANHSVKPSALKILGQIGIFCYCYYPLSFPPFFFWCQKTKHLWARSLGRKRESRRGFWDLGRKELFVLTRGGRRRQKRSRVVAGKIGRSEEQRKSCCVSVVRAPLLEGCREKKTRI